MHLSMSIPPVAMGQVRIQWGFDILKEQLVDAVCQSPKHDSLCTSSLVLTMASKAPPSGQIFFCQIACVDYCIPHTGGGGG